MAKAIERVTWDTLPGRPNDLVSSEALQAALANLLQARIVAGPGISTSYNSGTGILTISAISDSTWVIQSGLWVDGGIWDDNQTWSDA